MQTVFELKSNKYYKISFDGWELLSKKRVDFEQNREKDDKYGCDEKYYQKVRRDIHVLINKLNYFIKQNSLRETADKFENLKEIIQNLNEISYSDFPLYQKIFNLILNDYPESNPNFKPILNSTSKELSVDQRLNNLLRVSLNELSVVNLRTIALEEAKNTVIKALEKILGETRSKINKTENTILRGVCGVCSELISKIKEDPEIVTVKYINKIIDQYNTLEHYQNCHTSKKKIELIKEIINFHNENYLWIKNAEYETLEEIFILSSNNKGAAQGKLKNNNNFHQQGSAPRSESNTRNILESQGVKESRLSALLGDNRKLNKTNLNSALQKSTPLEQLEQLETAYQIITCNEANLYQSNNLGCFSFFHRKSPFTPKQNEHLKLLKNKYIEIVKANKKVDAIKDKALQKGGLVDCKRYDKAFTDTRYAINEVYGINEQTTARTTRHFTLAKFG